MRYRNIFIILSLIFFSFSARAELLLLEKKGDGSYQAIDYSPSSGSDIASSSNNNNNNNNISNKNEVEKIFEDILLRYQWPMVTMYFKDFPEDEKKRYLEALELKQENGILKFVNQKLQDNYKDKYKVIFVPTTVFDLAVINSFAINIINSKAPVTNGSIFAEKDLRNGEYTQYSVPGTFLDDYETDLITHMAPNNSSLSIIKNVFERYNFRPEIKEMYFHAIKYLEKNFSLKELEELKETEASIGSVIQALLKDYWGRHDNFFKEAENKDKGLYMKFEEMEVDLKYMYLEQTDAPLLIKGAIEEVKAAKDNEFLLFRGGTGFKLGDKKNPRGEQLVVDTPIREIKENYKSAIQGNNPLPPEILPIKPTIDPSQGNLKKFVPATLSFNSSLLAGMFYEAATHAGARPLDYMRDKPKDNYVGAGYVLAFPIKEYIVSNSEKVGPTLFQKYYISPLYSIVSLFTKGEFFHSRSKISLNMLKEKKNIEWAGRISGVEYLGNAKEFIDKDKANRIGFFITPDIDWTTLSSDITLDVANNMIWIKELNVWLDKLTPQEKVDLLEILRRKDNTITLENIRPEEMLTLLKGIISDMSISPSDKDKKILKNVENIVRKSKDSLAETLRNVSYFNLIEIDAFKAHYAKFQNALAPIMMIKDIIFTPPLTPSKMKKDTFAPDDRKYNDNNIFYKITVNPVNIKTVVRAEEDTADIIAFDDQTKRTKEHIIVIPRAPQISFTYFAEDTYYNNMIGFFRELAELAEKEGLDKTGYRIISNHSLEPGKSDSMNDESRKYKNNDATQEIPHFHIHMTGGECLGQPVLGVAKGKTKDDTDMAIKALPYGFDLSPQQFLADAMSNKIAELPFEDPEKGPRKLIAYRIPQPQSLNVTNYIGFILLDEAGKSVYKSIHDFFKSGTEDEIKKMMNFIDIIARSEGIYQTGFRLIGNHGRDAWQAPNDIMQLSIAGGNLLGDTVTNVWGNRDGDSSDPFERPYRDYDHLDEYVHDHCPAPTDIAKYIPFKARKVGTTTTTTSSTPPASPRTGTTTSTTTTSSTPPASPRTGTTTSTTTTRSQASSSGGSPASSPR